MHQYEAGLDGFVSGNADLRLGMASVIDVASDRDGADDLIGGVRASPRRSSRTTAPRARHRRRGLLRRWWPGYNRLADRDHRLRFFRSGRRQPRRFVGLLLPGEDRTGFFVLTLILTYSPSYPSSWSPQQRGVRRFRRGLPLSPN